MDTELVIRAQEGDEAAFAVLTTRMTRRLNDIAYGVLRDRSLAEDATQRGLVEIWRKLPRLRDPARFEAWSYRFIVHACYAEANSVKRSLPDLRAVSEPITADAIGAVDDRDSLERAFRRLSVDQRAVVVLHHYLDLPVSEVAQALDIPAGTVRSRLDRAMTKLRLALHVEEPTARPAAREVAR